LAKDLKYNTFVALKIQKSAQHYLEAAYDEVEILEQASTKWNNKEWQESYGKYNKMAGKEAEAAGSDSCQCIQLLNSFVHFGPNGKHFVMVFEILGVNLLEIIKRYNYRGIPLPLVRIIARQVLVGLDYLHRICNIIHTDLKPENVLLSLTNDELNQIIEKEQLGNNKLTYRFNANLLGDEKKKEESPKKTSCVQEEEKKEEKTRDHRLLSEEEKIALKKQKKKEKKKRLKKKKKAAKNGTTIPETKKEEKEEKEEKCDGAPEVKNQKRELNRPEALMKRRLSEPNILSPPLSDSKRLYNEYEDSIVASKAFDKNLSQDDKPKPFVDK
jgi:serine/threonine-protein kinase SRPK3